MFWGVSVIIATCSSPRYWGIINFSASSSESRILNSFLRSSNWESPEYLLSVLLCNVYKLFRVLVGLIPAVSSDTGGCCFESTELGGTRGNLGRSLLLGSSNPSSGWFPSHLRRSIKALTRGCKYKSSSVIAISGRRSGFESNPTNRYSSGWGTCCQSIYIRCGDWPSFPEPIKFTWQIFISKWYSLPFHHIQ